MSDFDSPADLQRAFPRIAVVALSTLRFLKFRVNLGPGKTEAMLQIRGPRAKEVRGAMLGQESCLHLPTGDGLRLVPEYRYLGVVQTPRDTGRRDTDLCFQRAHTAWAHARGLIASTSLPWALKQAWFAGRVLPAAYAALATNLAVSARATAPLAGFFEKAARHLLQSWHFGHLVTKPALFTLLGLSAPEHAVLVARVRLVLQLIAKAPPAVWELFDAAWNRDTPWCRLLGDACRQVLPAVRNHAGAPVSHCTILALSQHQGVLVKALRFLSRWGTAQAACCDLWHDVVTAREKKVLGSLQPCECPICNASLPSRHALAAHIHRRHSVVSSYTKLTHGTVCLWCHTEMHSTDRLKYHLRTTPLCLHGLRVTVGEVYSYGTGTKRTGRRRHVGLPASRLPGPINATPAQRNAALHGRACTNDELADELRRATGASRVDEWPAAAPRDASLVEPAPAARARPPTPASDAAMLGEPEYRWFNVVPASQADCAAADGVTCLSPYWPGLLRAHGIWRLPRPWHQYWHLWSALEAGAAWDLQYRRAFAILRKALAASPRADGPSWDIVDLVSATVTFRRICECVAQGGALWIQGRPSPVGQQLFRSILPGSRFYNELTPSGAVSVVAHPGCHRSSWFDHLSSLCDVVARPASPPVLPLRASLVYRTNLPDRG